MKLGNPEAVTILPEKGESFDWPAILRASYLFSQGSMACQGNMFRWLSAGPLHGQKIPIYTHEAVVPYAVALAKDDRHHKATTSGGDAIDEKSATSVAKHDEAKFDSWLKENASLDGERLEQERREALTEIAVFLLDRELMYIEKGRPVGPESRRDKWSSFVIDFGLLHKGDGMNTWNGTPEVFKELWSELLPVFKEKEAERMHKLIDLYIERHPQLLVEDRERIEGFLR